MCLAFESFPPRPPKTEDRSHPPRRCGGNEINLEVEIFCEGMAADLTDFQGVFKKDDR